MAKPRNSVLYLFDPLQQSPSTPRRDSSPELGASDKENDFSAGDVTMFFNRMYAAPKAQDARPQTPKGQLIDFGDTPAQGMLWDDTVHDGSDADEEQSENEGECSVANVAPRTPLAELSVEDTPRPLQDSRRPLLAPAFAPSSPSPKEQPLRALLAAPHGSPFAEVINSITFSALSIADDTTTAADQPPLFRKEVSEDGRVPSPFPEITICAPETPSVANFDLGHNEEPSETSATSQSRLRPTSALTQLSPDDPRRTSVDLHSSFHLHMQSDDMSFDLLNDKISFLGNAQDSFWAGADDTMFDFDEENCKPTTEGIKNRLAPVEEQPMEETRRVFSPPKVAIDVLVANSPITAAMRVPLPMSPPPSTPRFDSPRILAEHVAMPPSPPTSPVSLDEPSLMMELEPLPPPVLVPALRIMKKTFKMTGRIYSTPPAAETSDPTPARQPAEKLDPVTKKSSPMAAESPAVTVPATISAPQPQHPRPNYRGVQRPPASMLAAGVVIGLPPQGSSHNTSTSTSSSSSAGSSASRATRPQDGSRFAAAGIQRPALPSKERSVPRSATAVPARQVKAPSGISRAASASAAVLRSAVGASGLRPPSRIAAPGSGAGSTLPRPASRLPGPSAPGLTRTASTTSGIGRPRSVTAPRVPTGGRF